MPPIVPADSESIRRAAEVIRAGGLIAFPTETVYGLGANALAPDAVARIFAAKGRPATNPIIVHVLDVAMLTGLVTDFEAAKPLIRAFWPGPLTLVFSKSFLVPGIVTAGGPTVAIRSPQHPTALALIKEAGVPIAAPSANRSESLSPTRAEHVAYSFGDEVAMILDGGPCAVGIESTVLDMTQTPPRILRPGMVTQAQIERVLGLPLSEQSTMSNDSTARSPGQMPRHYAPRTPLFLTMAPYKELDTRAARVGLVCHSDPPPDLSANVLVQRLPDTAAEYSAELYAALHRLDAVKLDAIFVQSVPATPEWSAVRDRLTRAAKQ